MELLKNILEEEEMPIVITKKYEKSHMLKDITHTRVSGVLL